MEVADAGTYECRATNEHGSASSTIGVQMQCGKFNTESKYLKIYQELYSHECWFFSVLPEPVITAPTEVLVGRDAMLRCEARGATPEPDYTWYRDNTVVHRASEYRLEKAHQWLTGEYRCEVRNICGEKSTTHSVRIAGEKPEIRSKSVDRDNNYTGNNDFACIIIMGTFSEGFGNCISGLEYNITGHDNSQSSRFHSQLSCWQL